MVIGLDKQRQTCSCTFTCRTSRFTWHEGIIPASEIWLNIGGDKGGGTFKMNLQTATSNTVHNTCACVLLLPNLHVALDHFKLILGRTS